jgi:hypothetical protein
MDRRLRLLLIVAVFFGVPALLTLALIDSDHAQEAQRGLQPGGAIRGRVLGPDGKGVAGVELDLLLDPSAPGAAPAEAIAARAESTAEGRFELAAPPLEGRYTVVAGGGTWQRVARSFSFVGEGASEEFTLAVLPGCELEAEFTREDGSAAGAGSFELEGHTRGGWFVIFGQPPVRVQGRVEDGKLRAEALPPMKAKLRVHFVTGESLELELELEPGKTRKSVRI